jgi:hypothetical protein
MSIDVPLIKLQDAWRECERHVYHLIHALSSISAFSPLTGESIDLLTDEQVQDIDQFILRYTKLQDTMGSRLFTSILNYLYEPVDNRPMLDVLHRLEKLGLIDSIVMWQEVRLVRNRFAHDYANDPEKNAEQLNIAFESTLDLYSMLNTIRTWFSNAYPTLELGKELPEMPGNL